VINFTDRYAGTESCTEHSGFVRHNDAGRDDVEGEDRRGVHVVLGSRRGKTCQASTKTECGDEWKAHMVDELIHEGRKLTEDHVQACGPKDECRSV
jgi:hypothetical protein